MKRYLAVFTGSPDGMTQWQALPEAERKRREAEGMAAWGQWAQDHSAQILDMGGPLSRTKRVSKDGISDVRINLGGFTLVQAESQEAAAAMFLQHPHFMLFPGDAVEVMEVMPVPGM